MSLLAEIDLNLLVVLDALLAERSVTRAAARVGLSQPAMSSALGRLRKRLGDPLLVRTAEGMVPTPRAVALGVPLREALSTLEQALESAVDFDPLRARRTFSVACSDYAHVVVVPQLTARLAELAPRCSLRVFPVREGMSLAGELERGRAELALGLSAKNTAPGGALLHDRWVCALRAGHPLLGALSVEALLAAGHVAVLPQGEGGEPLDQLLSSGGLERRVALRVPQLAAAALAVAGSELLWVVPERVVRALAPLGIVSAELPITMPELSVSMAWHKRMHHEPAQAWFRAMVRGLYGERCERAG